MNAAEESGSKSNVQVWKLNANTEQDSNDPGCHQQALQSFTLQETLFVEQLAAIDERVRNQVCVCVFEITFFCRRSIFDDCLRQVPIDPAHVRSFLNTAVFGTFVTKITIMHAYQTCIKRIVRFANSLQVRSLTTLKNSDPISSGLCRAPAWRYAKTSCSQHSEFHKKKSSIHLKV